MIFIADYSPGPASLTLMMAVRINSQSIVMSHNEHESGVNKKKLLVMLPITFLPFYFIRMAQ